MDKERTVTSVREWRRIGKQRFKWVGDIREDLEKMKIKISSTITMDRKAWKRTVEQVTTHADFQGPEEEEEEEENKKKEEEEEEEEEMEKYRRKTLLNQFRYFVHHFVQVNPLKREINWIVPFHKPSISFSGGVSSGTRSVRYTDYSNWALSWVLLVFAGHFGDSNSNKPELVRLHFFTSFLRCHPLYVPRHRRPTWARMFGIHAIKSQSLNIYPDIRAMYTALHCVVFSPAIFVRRNLFPLGSPNTK